MLLIPENCSVWWAHTGLSTSAQTLYTNGSESRMILSCEPHCLCHHHPCASAFPGPWLQPMLDDEIASCFELSSRPPFHGAYNHSISAPGQSSLCQELKVLHIYIQNGHVPRWCSPHVHHHSHDWGALQAILRLSALINKMSGQMQGVH